MDKDQVLRKLAGPLRGSKFMRRPMQFGMAACNEAVVSRHYHQVQLLPTVSQRVRDCILKVGLPQLDLKGGTEKVVGLDGRFGDYVNDGQFVLNKRGWGRVTFVRKDGAVMWPERYELQPTFRDEDLNSVEAGLHRLKALDEIHETWCPMIELRWSLIEEALESGKRVDDASTDGRCANLYQAVAGDGGLEMWVARLPSLWRSDGPDANHFVELPSERNGVAVRLTPRFLENLRDVVPAMLEDGFDWVSTYYKNRVPAPPDPFEKAEETFEELLEELRLAKENGTLNEDELEDMLVECGNQVVEELRRVMFDEQDTE